MTLGNSWANGFLRGMQLREPAWSAMVNDEERGGPFIPIFALACEHHPDPEMRPYAEPMTPERRESLQISMIAGVLQLYRSFADDRRRFAGRGPNVVPFRPKVGRNDLFVRVVRARSSRNAAVRLLSTDPWAHSLRARRLWGTSSFARTVKGAIPAWLRARSAATIMPISVSGVPPATSARISGWSASMVGDAS